jgi:hypothetical protein
MVPMQLMKWLPKPANAVLNRQSASTTTDMHIDKITLFPKRKHIRPPYVDVLVPDIWHAVASFLQPSVLAELCLVSSHFLEIFRPILYRYLILKFDARHTGLTLKLLCSHDTLAQHVISLTIHAPSRKDSKRTKRLRRWTFITRSFPSPQERLIEAISNMFSLQTIKMYNIVFTSIMEERVFAEKLRNYNIPIKNFTFVADSYRGSYHEEMELSKNGLNLTNLTALTWELRETSKEKLSKLFEVSIIC